MDDPEVVLPTAHEVRAACWAARLLHPPRTRVVDARDSYRRSPNGGQFREADLFAGEELLIAAGLISRDQDFLEITAELSGLAALDHETASLLVVTSVLERTPPMWLRSAAGGGEVRGELIPEEADAELRQLLGDPARREAMLLTAARRHDAALLAGIGLAGEEHVEQQCRDELGAAAKPELSSQVSRVSAISDVLGYDVVAPTLAGTMRRLEVKTTRRSGWRTEIYISRNEFEVGLADPDWALVVCEMDGDDDVTTVGWCRADAIRGLVPADQHAHGRWVNANLLLVEVLLTPGLPPL
jgi:hypothetical protein